jgi:hypothetical protein
MSMKMSLKILQFDSNRVLDVAGKEDKYQSKNGDTIAHII